MTVECPRGGGKELCLANLGRIYCKQKIKMEPKTGQTNNEMNDLICSIVCKPEYAIGKTLAILLPTQAGCHLTPEVMPGSSYACKVNTD